MKSLALSVSLVAVLARSAFAANGCRADNCARAVTGTRRGPEFVSSAMGDCSSFVVETTYAYTETVVVTTEVAAVEKTSPWYATACSGTSRYSSACSCWGITSTVVSDEGTTTTTVSQAPEPTGEPYEPEIPESYASCAFDPSSTVPFELLTPNLIPIIEQDGKVVEASDPDAEIGTYSFSHPAGAPDGVFDLVYTFGSESSYFAVFESGEVGFVSSSSNGQGYTDAADPYVTTIFSVSCSGFATAGILSPGTAFSFVVTDAGAVVLSSAPSPSRLRRDIPVPQGFFIYPTERAVPAAGEKCPGPAGEQEAVAKVPPVAPSSNECGPGDWRGGWVPNLDFREACDFHDLCWADCSQTFASCNQGFLDRMHEACEEEHEYAWVVAGCKKLADRYFDAVSGDSGAEVYARTVGEFCDCRCVDESRTACGAECVDTTSDPENCGACYFNCPSGGCTNGACSFNSCTGQTCSTFGPCGPGGSCVCASVTDGTGFCVDGGTSCSGLDDCGSSADCPLGSVCAVGTCCGRNVCITTDQCGGYDVPAMLFLAVRDGTNATIGHPGSDA